MKKFIKLVAFMRRRLELDISTCKECPYCVYEEGRYNCNKVDRTFIWIPTEDLWEWEKGIPPWCSLPYMAYTIKED